MVEDMVYKFLDNYVGEGINVSDEGRMYDPYDFMPVRIYFISSDNQTRIIKISYKEDKPSIVYEKRLGDVVSNFFSIDSVSSHAHIGRWFKKRNNIESLWELKNLIPTNPSL